jgi:hypothetical protein
MRCAYCTLRFFVWRGIDGLTGSIGVYEQMGGHGVRVAAGGRAGQNTITHRFRIKIYPGPVWQTSLQSSALMNLKPS